MYIIDQFVTTKIGEPYRLFPFGEIVKNGRKIEITPETAQLFKLPHFKPPIKLGSHADTTPAAGHIVGLEIRADGIYAIPEWNDSGAAALNDGAYRYHSPEIIWDGEIEDSSTGNVTSGTIIMGDALLHTPALGEAAAFYQAKLNGGHKPMAEETLTAPVSFFEKLISKLEGEPNQKPEPPQPDNYAAQVETLAAKIESFEAQLAEKNAEIERLKAAQENAAKISHFAAELAETAVAEDAELLTLLAGMEPEKADKLVTKFKALSAQAQAGNLTQELGHEGDGQGTGDKFGTLEAAIAQYQADHAGVSYTQAIQHLTRVQPELFSEVR